MAKVTIITSVYNKGPWLRRFFDSLINQTFKDIEILVINNASTDESVNIIDEYKKIDKRIRVIELKDNVGAAGGYEVGINNVKTEYFGLCDADDYVENNYVEVLYNKLVDNDADMSMCTNDMVWDDGTVKTNKRPGHDVILTKKDVPQILPQTLDHYSNKYLGYYLAELGVMWGKLYKTSFVKDNHVNFKKDEWFFCDWLFHFNLYKHLNKMVYTEDTCYHFFQSENSVTRSKGMNYKKEEQTKLIVSKFNLASKDVMSPHLKQAITKFYYLNACGVIDMHLDSCPDVISKKEIKDLIYRISNWEEINNISFFDKNGLKLYRKLKIFCVQHIIVFPLMLKTKIKRSLL